ncbi:GNAT family N-acetyltransferase [Mesobacillus subterraneus]|uniref:GNAT family N-acetyltransferase n=1 Tax=Mesobacillus subterraneus TaxID=285983 RepID=UPI0020409606|nr:GNAT family protein [Mesobacillus subterraneus]MCM3664270.1 GNAT family N-acetyltransferase [Mesobacillus subterraneus]MCM3682297.1 GNAT family N-acetyltransferase [Mesobacillus subterraneus]
MKREIKLDGQTVRLVPMEIEQLDDLWKAGHLQEIWEFTASKIKSKEDMREAIKAAADEREKGTQYPFVVVDKETGKIIGSSRYLDISEAHKSLEIGWTWYHPEYWRTRVNTETKFLMLGHAFEEMGMNRVQFCTDSRNIRSRKAIARLGAEKEGVLRKHRIIADGYVRDTVVFSIIKDDWQMVKSLLQEKMNRS